MKTTCMIEKYKLKEKTLLQIVEAKNRIKGNKRSDRCGRDNSITILGRRPHYR